MIIDAHAHLMSPEWPPQKFWDNWVKLLMSMSGRPREAVLKRIPDFCDPTAEKLLADMDAAGIDKTVIMPNDFGLLESIGEGAVSIEDQNLIFANLAKAHPDRLIAFVSFDLRRKEGPQLLERGVREWGMKGLKLLPSLGFYPDEPSFYPVYEKAQELGIPVLFHTGPEGPPFYSKYGRPANVDTVATDFPDLQIILAHAGHCWWHEAMEIASVKPNVHVDVALWQMRLRRDPVEEFYRPLRVMLDKVGSRKVIFGSDWPSLKNLVDQQRWVKAFAEPPETVKEAGIEFKETEIEAVLGQNAARLLKLG